MGKIDQKNWERDFVDFVSADNESVPRALSENVMSNISRELNPSAISVFAKLSGVHLLACLASLSVCPQFGVSLSQGPGLMGFMMKSGEAVCMLGCGAVFTGMSFLLASLLLRPEEVRALKKNRTLQAVTLSMLSLAAFVCIGQSVLVPITALWLVGAVVSGILFLEIGWKVRVQSVLRGAA